MAAEVKARLESEGHQSIFLDFDPADGIPAGRDWERELYQRIRSCRAMIVLCSRHSMASRWCFMEITHARALGKPLFAVRIEDCELDGVLTDHQVVDLTVDRETGFRRLFAGILAAGLDPADSFDWDGTRPPYPGLMAFQEEDAAVFFGRDEEVGQGLDLLNRVHRLDERLLVMILGASGTGKSSLLRAGILPQLRRDPGRWLVVDPFRPREDPAREFGAVLSRAFARVGHELPSEQIVESLHHSMRDPPAAASSREDHDAIADLCAELRRRSGRSDAQVVLVVDQLEELLGHPERHASSRFLAALRRAIERATSPVVVIGTMRSDFLGQFQSHPVLLDLRYDPLSVGPMSRADIVQIIERPAEVAGLELGSGLAEALVSDADSADALPLLAFTLRELYERFGDDRRLELDEYRRELGGLQKVVGQAADDVVRAAGIDSEEEKLLRAAFVAMARVTEEGNYARQSARWDELPLSIHPLLERFVQARLLISRTLGEDRTVEVAHESLFRSWGHLAHWIEESAEALHLRREIGLAAQSWEDAGQPDEELWRGGRLTRARELLETGDLPLSELELRFVEASEQARQAQREAEERRRRRVLLTVFCVAAGALILASVAGVFWYRAGVAQQDAQRQATSADERARLAAISSERALAAQNFAEYQRVLARAKVPGIDRDQQDALKAIAPKYLIQSKAHEARADRLEVNFEAWRARQSLERRSASELFSLEILRAGGGGSVLLHFGRPGLPRHMLFDGGDNGTYRESLRPRLEALRRLRPGKERLPLDLVVSTQTDMTHLAGLLELMDELQEANANGTTPHFMIRALWSNAFVPGDARNVERLARLWHKAGLVSGANALDISVNGPFSRLITLPEAGAARVRWDGGLTLTVLGPPVQWMREFARFWLLQWRSRADSRTPIDLDFDILETFASRRIELLPSPIEIVDPPSPRGEDRSVVNLGSIVLMLELGGRRALLTADATSDVLLHALAQAGYTDEQGNMNLDVLVLPHAGSARNLSREFFRRVKARRYVVLSDGTYGNPDVETFEALFDARRDDAHRFTIYFSYSPEEYRSSYPVDELCSRFDRARAAGVRFETVTPRPGQAGVGMDLLARADFTDKGIRNGICRA